MAKAIQDFLFGLFFGAGFACANGILAIISQIIASHH